MGFAVTNLRDVTANIVMKITTAYEKIVFHRCAVCAVVWLVIVIRKKESPLRAAEDLLDMGDKIRERKRERETAETSEDRGRNREKETDRQ